MGTVPAPDIVEAAGQIARAPQDALSEYARVAGLKAQTQQMQANTQGTQLENQARQQAMHDQQIASQTLQSWDGGDLNGLLAGARKNGISASGYMGLQKNILDSKSNLLKLTDEQFAHQVKISDLTQGVHDTVSQAPPEQKQQAYTQGLQSLAAAGVDVSKESPQYPGDAAFAQHLPAVRLHSAITAEAQKDRTIAAEEVTAQSKMDAAHKPTVEEQNFQSWYKAGLAASGQQPSAAAELKARDEWRQSNHPQAVDRAEMNDWIGKHPGKGPADFMAAKAALAKPQVSNTDVQDIADAIESGDQPPTLTGLYSNAAPVRAELGRRGVPIAKMETDWKATQKYMSSLNGSQQVRLRQAVETANDSLDKIEGLYKEWQDVAPTSGFKILNKAALGTMKQLPGKPGAVANALDAQIADLTAELGNVYMGGNSPTDHSLSLAGKNLQSDWNKETFEEALKQARANIVIRRNSILHGAPVGSGGENKYFQSSGGPGGAAPSSGTVKVRDPRGIEHTFPDQASADKFKKLANIQ